LTGARVGVVDGMEVIVQVSVGEAIGVTVFVGVSVMVGVFVKV